MYVMYVCVYVCMYVCISEVGGVDPTGKSDSFRSFVRACVRACVRSCVGARGDVLSKARVVWENISGAKVCARLLPKRSHE